jgi:chaperone protein EcpD
MSVVVLAGSLFVTQVHAAIVISGTRIIYPSDQKEVSVEMNNAGGVPLLIQSWIDDGNAQSTPDTTKVPFVLTPPITRVNGHQGQTLRVRYTGQGSLPQDKESVFWLNVLEVPPSSASGANTLKVAFRSRVKLFYRPIGLQFDLTQSVQKMKWQLRKSANSWVIEGTNTSAHYLTFNSVKVGSNTVTLNLASSMFAPGEHKSLKLKGTPAPGINQVELSAINDYGGINNFQLPLVN